MIDLCDGALARKARRQHRFECLLGDPGKNGQCRKLPADAYYDDLALVIEFIESRHTQPTPFFDKSHKHTVSGVHSGEQRKLYDERRQTMLPKHGITLIALDASWFRRTGGTRKKLLRDSSHDQQVIRERLARFLQVRAG